MKPSADGRTPGHRHDRHTTGAGFSANAAPRGAARLLFGAALALGALSCSDRATGPVADQIIRITDSNFIPGDLLLERGVRIEWQNASREARTVTSGLNAADPEAGALFDAELAGYRAGEPTGGAFSRRFTEVDTIRYFSRHVPENFVGNFGGRIIIR